MWACKWLASADKPAGPTPVEVRDALARVEQAAEALHRALDALPAEAMDLLAHRLTWYPGLPSELVFTKLRPTRTLEDFAPGLREFALRSEKLAQLRAARRDVARALPPEVARLAAAAGRARGAVEVPKGRRPRSYYRKPLWELASIWVEATGKAPTVAYDAYRGGRYGPFRELVYAAAAPVFPGMGGADELVAETCERWRAICAEWRRRGQL